MILYFDPGLGALIVQFLIALMAGITLFYRRILAKIKTIFGIKKASKDRFDTIDVDPKTQQNSDRT